MNAHAKTLLKVYSLVLILGILGSCSNFLDSGIAGSANGNKGSVKICLGSPGGETGTGDAAGSTDNSRAMTFLPDSVQAKYGFKFSSTSSKQTEIAPQAINNNSLSVTLETGTWTVAVTRYETVNGTDNPVASGTSSSFAVAAGSNNPDVTVILNPIPGGTGVFSYQINLSGISAGAALTLRAVDGSVEYSIPDIAANISKQYLENIPSGDYDVFVSLLAADGSGRGTGEYSVACIYPGLETAGVFSFTAANFVSSVYLAGHVTIVNDSGIQLQSGTNVKVTAYNSTDGLEAGATSYQWSPGQEWILSILPTIPSVYFTVDVTGADNHDYKKEYAAVVNNIGAAGRDNIELTLGIYTIDTSGPWTSEGNSITPSRTAASPGEPVYLTVASTYGLRQGSLTVLNGTNEIPVSGSDESYSFEMPEGNVTLADSAYFYTAKLANLTVTSPLNSVNLLTSFVPGTFNYTLNVPNDVSSVTVTGTPGDYDAAVAVSGASAQNLVTGSAGNTVTITVTPPPEAAGKSGNTYTITVYRDKSPLNKLSSLTVDQGTLTPIFDPAVNSYTVTVDNSVGSIKVGAAAADSLATVSGNGIYSLAVWPAPNTIPVTVEAEDGSVNTYTIDVTRSLSKVNTLDSLAINPGSLNETFSGANTSYSANVDFGVSSVTVSAAATDPGAAIDGAGLYNLSVGSNTITVTVTPPSGDQDRKIYTIVIRRSPSATSALRDLSVSPGVLGPQFDPAVTSYTVIVPYTTSAITVDAAAPDYGTVFGTGTYNLTVGDTPIYITAIAQSGSQNIYTVTVTRSQPAVNVLGNLAVNAGSLNPAFDPAVTFYTVNVPYSTTGITVGAAAPDYGSVLGTGTYNLAVGETVINITSIGQDASQKVYSVTVTRSQPAENVLGDLTVNTGDLDPAFDPSILSYAVNVPYSTLSITVNAVAPDYGSVLGTGTYNLAAGGTVINITSIGQDASQKVYSVTVTRSAPSAGTLSGINVYYDDHYSTDPDNPDQTIAIDDPDPASYTVTVDDPLVTQVTINAIPAPGAFVLDNNKTYALTGDTTTITFNVIPESGVPDQKQYTIVLYHEAEQ